MSLLKRITTIDKSYAHFRRYVEIVEILVKFGYGDFLNRRRLKKPEFRRRTTGVAELARLADRPERVRLMLEELGPTFVKLGQVLSSRPDLLPDEYIRELGKLRDSVPGFPPEEAIRIIESELGRPLKECFSHFDEKPFAAASIGQAHYAVTPDNIPIVVKVQRPGIEKVIGVDLDIMYHLAGMLERSDLLEDLSAQRPTAIVEEFSRVLKRELDYVVEATNARRFAQDMRDQPGVSFPLVIDRLSSHKVLTQSRVIGTPVHEVFAHAALREKFNLPCIAHNGAAALMAQIFEHGFFHADPHAGNLFLQEGDILCFIDFGMMGRVTEMARYDFVKAVRAMLNRDYPLLVRAVLRLTAGCNEKVDTPRLERELGELVEDNLYLSMAKFSLANVLEELMKVMTRNGLALRSDLYVMFKSLITIENIARELDPDMAIIDILEPAMRKAQKRARSWRRHWRNFSESMEELNLLANDLPTSLREILRKAKEDDIHFQLELHGLYPMRETIRESVGTLSYAVVLASLVIGSALIVLSRVPPMWNGVPVIGVVGFVISALLGFGLLWRAHKKPR